MTMAALTILRRYMPPMNASMITAIAAPMTNVMKNLVSLKCTWSSS